MHIPSGVESLDILKTQHARLGVEVVAETKPALPVTAPLSEVLRCLAVSGFVVLLGARRQVVGGIASGQILDAQSLPKDWLSQAYRQEPEAFAVSCLLLDASIGGVADLIEQTGLPFVPLVDAKGRYTGQCASADRLSRLARKTLRPARVGGLATPLGVYMTSGYYNVGAGWPGLLATGALFGGLARLMDGVGLIVYSALVALFPQVLGLPGQEQALLQMGLLLTTLLVLLRLSPLAGLHAAEHMTINALERDLSLTDAVVRQQPREHRRCGTNLLMLLGGMQLLGLAVYMGATRLNPVGLLLYTALWAWLVFSYWRPAGLWLQRHFTTKPPSEAQLRSGLKAGQELLTRFSERPHGDPGFWRRLWGAGFFQMLMAFVVAFWLVDFLMGQWRWF
ncbi:DUF1385 domain-containing protein [Vampirovibrio chlorellavorus]|uniref:DUF1385 domain-containing protein n=1 Tax=Vampirovibrio chlorellavorus TaxID=758823 RepID=UPI0026EE55CB|nr:DUF1385 domain-containing protein [Vampirovibrio chlorellavorus]